MSEVIVRVRMYGWCESRVGMNTTLSCVMNYVLSGETKTLLTVYDVLRLLAHCHCEGTGKAVHVLLYDTLMTKVEGLKSFHISADMMLSMSVFLVSVPCMLR